MEGRVIIKCKCGEVFLSSKELGKHIKKEKIKLDISKHHSAEKRFPEIRPVAELYGNE